MAFSSPYLAGNFAPVTDETTITGLTVDGTLPAELDGQYLRLGPNPAHRPDEPYEWHSTDTMVHAVELRDGRAVAYRNRWVLTSHVAAVLGVGPPAAHVDCCERLVLAGRTVLAVARSGTAYDVSDHLGTRATRAVDLPVVDSCLGDDRARGHDHHPLPTTSGATVRTDRGLAVEHGPDGHRDVIDPTPQGWMTASRAAPARFVYTLAVHGDRPFSGSLIYKHDLHRRVREQLDFGPGRHPGELEFVPDDRRRHDEDGGWLVGFVHDATRGADDLVVLDAQHPADGPVATVRLPRRVPFGWHGLWRPR